MNLNLQLSEGNNVYFTSDLHFGHKNIVGPSVSKWSSGYRIFEHTHQMNQHLLDELNTVVKKEDVLFFLGDFTFKGSDTVKNFRNKINCKNIHFIIGNHDKYKSVNYGGFSSVNDTVRVTIKGQEFFLSHYAHRVWPNHHRNCIHLYGHSHNSIEDEKWGRSMDVGVDAYYARYGYYRPFSFDEIMDIMVKRKLKLTDKHGTVDIL